MSKYGLMIERGDVVKLPHATVVKPSPHEYAESVCIRPGTCSGLVNQRRGGHIVGNLTQGLSHSLDRNTATSLKSDRTKRV